jgi:hypothetical protein
MAMTTGSRLSTNVMRPTVAAVRVEQGRQYVTLSVAWGGSTEYVLPAGVSLAVGQEAPESWLTHRADGERVLVARWSDDPGAWRLAYQASRAMTSPEESIALAQEAYAADRIDARELERRVGEALGVR